MPLRSMMAKVISRQKIGETMGKSNISRRSFIAGGAIAGSLIAGAALGGCAPTSDKKSSNEGASATAKSDTRWSFETSPDPIKEEDIVETIDVDIVIAGAGQAGMLAALTAAESGAKTIVLQKGSTVQTTGRGAAFCNTQMHKDAGAYFDPATYMSQLQMEACGKSDPRIMRTWFEQSGETCDYINNLVKDIDDAGFVLSQGKEKMTVSWVNAVKYHRQQTMIETLLPIAEGFGAEFRYKTAVQQLEYDDRSNRVTGVIALGPDGYIKVNASKGVILATGDISHDEEMVEKYCPYIKDIVRLGFPENTGDGHKAALWIGAQMERPPHGQMVHYDPTPLPEGDSPFSGNPYLAVNQNGERFMDENLSYQYNVLTVSRQPNQIMFQIIDGSLKDNWEKFVGTGYRRNAVNASSEEAWQTGLENGAILQADTLEQLAELMDVPAETFVATCDRYQSMVDSGKDEDFGKDPTLLALTPVKTAPFYAIKRQPAILATLGGLACTPKLEVLDNENNVIGGLYAAGNVVGLCFGYDYSISIGGISCGRAMCFGRVAAKSALGTLDTYDWEN